MKITLIPDAYFEALGEPKPARSFGLIDDYRFYVTFKCLMPGSVLDVGTYCGDFLKLAYGDDRDIYGTEVNQKRVDLANELLGSEVVVLDFRNGRLLNFADKSVDNVVCTEVLEHVPDQNLAISELCRVARRRVIITVPFREKIKHVLCLHCCTYTPYSGHLHTYDLHTFHDLVPEGWLLTHQRPIAKTLINLIIERLNLPRWPILLLFIQILDSLVQGNGKWLLIVLDRDNED